MDTGDLRIVAGFGRRGRVGFLAGAVLGLIAIALLIALMARPAPDARVRSQSADAIHSDAPLARVL